MATTKLWPDEAVVFDHKCWCGASWCSQSGLVEGVGTVPHYVSLRGGIDIIDPRGRSYVVSRANLRALTPAARAMLAIAREGR